MGIVMSGAGCGLWYRRLDRYDINPVLPFAPREPETSTSGGVFPLGERLILQIAADRLITVAGVAFIVVERNPFKMRSL